MRGSRRKATAALEIELATFTDDYLSGDDAEKKFCEHCEEAVDRDFQPDQPTTGNADHSGDCHDHCSGYHDGKPYCNEIPLHFSHCFLSLDFLTVTRTSPSGLMRADSVPERQTVQDTK